MHTNIVSILCDPKRSRLDGECEVCRVERCGEIDSICLSTQFVSGPILFGARGGSVGWGTSLQAGRSWVQFPMMSLEFFIDIILPAALNLQEKLVPGVFTGGG
jgi:hypothetical protein